MKGPLLRATIIITREHLSCPMPIPAPHSWNPSGTRHSGDSTSGDSAASSSSATVSVNTSAKTASATLFAYDPTLASPRLHSTMMLVCCSGNRASIARKGPFSSLGELMSSIIDDANPGETVVFSPGCTSFEMFLNEFDRGARFKSIVEEIKE